MLKGPGKTYTLCKSSIFHSELWLLSNISVTSKGVSGGVLGLEIAIIAIAHHHESQGDCYIRALTSFKPKLNQENGAIKALPLHWNWSHCSNILTRVYLPSGRVSAAYGMYSVLQKWGLGPGGQNVLASYSDELNLTEETVPKYSQWRFP
ncbi:predicted protein [Aspergillus nidulans FGSC A4]|uniref:Uncharacterized protein n=1 Tax=Emericella nidulans (strain FGSC A4 / ATCC 38163 / CBS 112.46 / NRRL 194 / M139) TaxID=227321 RepID=Q5AQJ0_EMENI|nr:hypothetical protein [Aspergillus nidulans FGSC A4]EAA66814.1 predicted protein [Aspergillus nidulans FGSC A4]CBF71825.1 TPA: conserved hypothetical protein [Aspergillus nidulans FGSC A4]|eukprot:XP_868822.1 predicted protein [Aspergillus nidulans FGSC A4]